ncbi:MAG: PAS domain-containing protein, partial [Acidobacteria bacterium]|nr:PAS domain-containing protein [Acidobacteriota bacterium]
MAEPEQKLEDERALRRRIGWLIVCRMVAAVLFLMAAAVWTHGGISALAGVALSGTLPIFIVVVFLSLIYVLALRFLNRLESQVSAQLMMDVLLVTWLVWATGDISSPYAAAYILVISAASIFLGPRGALITSVGCVTAFTFITLATSAGFIPAYAHDPENALTAKAVQSIGINDVAFLVVGLLAAQLTGRQARSDVQLIEATQTLASLRALHERIVESIRSGVVTTDLKGRIYTFNAAAEEITGYRA